MSYSPKHYYRGKDDLSRGDPNKRVKGAELSDEFEAISTAIRKNASDIKDIGSNDAGKGQGVSWEVINKTGHNCEYSHAYLVDIPTANPQINLPSLGASDAGQYVVISDGGNGWSSVSDALTVNLNGPLQGQAVGQLALDLKNITVTFVWDGASWWVYSSMSSSTADGIGSDAPADGYIYGRKDNGWVQISSSGGGGGAVEWIDVLNKPQPIKDLASENTPKQSLISGGRY